MKFFSRKALVAGATAIAVSFAGVNVASAAEPKNNENAAVVTTEQDDNTGSSLPGSSTSGDPEENKAKLDNIKAWIGIITAVVGALSAIYSFVNKISK